MISVCNPTFSICFSTAKSNDAVAIWRSSSDRIPWKNSLCDPKETTTSSFESAFFFDELVRISFDDVARDSTRISSRCSISSTTDDRVRRKTTNSNSIVVHRKRERRSSVSDLENVRSRDTTINIDFSTKRCVDPNRDDAFGTA